MIFENEIHPKTAGILTADAGGCETTIAAAKWPRPFELPLQYASPARGTWTIAHSPMLIPGLHEIYVCCACCLHGVVLSAEEIPDGGWDRFSMITVTSENIIKGNLEQMMIDGVTDIIHGLPQKPAAVECFTSCIQHFLHMDTAYVYRALRRRFPEIDFIDGYMIPTLQRRFAPDVLGRRQLMRAIRKEHVPSEAAPARETTPAKRPDPASPDHSAHAPAVNLVVNYYPLDPASELLTMFHAGGYDVRELATCKTYADYRKMASSEADLFFLTNSKAAAEDMEKRLGIPAVAAFYSWNYDEMEATERHLAEIFHLPPPDFEVLRKTCDALLETAWAYLNGRPIEIDYTATPRLLSLTRLLLEHGFNVQCIYSDAFTPEDQADLAWLKKHFPKLTVRSATHYKMRLHRPDALNAKDPAEADTDAVAIGQKAAYFARTSHFVNMIENGVDPRVCGRDAERKAALDRGSTRPVELYGFEGIRKMCLLLIEAAGHEKDTRSIIETKAWGCSGRQSDVSTCSKQVDGFHRSGQTKAATSVRAAQRVLSTYAVDLFGMTSVLYELGGMCVMHDASGCNSTYTTHDEPRWYDTPSLVVISGLNEIDTIEGNDRHLIDRVAEAAREVHPAFIAIGGSPMPSAIGTDFRAVTRLVEEQTGIPTLGIRTDGIHSYLTGAGEALRALAERFVMTPRRHLLEESPAGTDHNHTQAEVSGTDAERFALTPERILSKKSPEETDHAHSKTEVSGADKRHFPSKNIRMAGINLLGVTPLDFSVVGNATAFREICASHRIPLVSEWAMGSTLQDMENAASAAINCVVSATGLPAAKWMEETFGIPYIVGIPIGKMQTEIWVQSMNVAAESGRSCWFMERSEEKTTPAGEGSVENRDAAREQAFFAWKSEKAAMEGAAAATENPGAKASMEQTFFGGDGKRMPGAGDIFRKKRGLRQGLTSLPSWRPTGLMDGRCRVLIIGEPVFIRSLREFLHSEYAIPREEICLLCPFSDAPHELTEGMEIVPAEQDLREECGRADFVIADPYYARLLPDSPGKFIHLPHEAYSGRFFRGEAVRFVGPDISELRKRLQNLV
ncbi:MAG: nitrogenase component 1 [Lachnospiraceae bacterium]|nr:nitrogenase component 1 [Lachnospiraceae bacterium]